MEGPISAAAAATSGSSNGGVLAGGPVGVSRGRRRRRHYNARRRNRPPTSPRRGRTRRANVPMMTDVPTSPSMTSQRCSTDGGAETDSVGIEGEATRARLEPVIGQPEPGADNHSELGFATARRSSGNDAGAVAGRRHRRRWRGGGRRGQRSSDAAIVKRDCIGLNQGEGPEMKSSGAETVARDVENGDMEIDVGRLELSTTSSSVREDVQLSCCPHRTPPETTENDKGCTRNLIQCEMAPRNPPTRPRRRSPVLKRRPRHGRRQRRQYRRGDRITQGNVKQGSIGEVSSREELQEDARKSILGRKSDVADHHDDNDACPDHNECRERPPRADSDAAVSMSSVSDNQSISFWDLPLDVLFGTDSLKIESSFATSLTDAAKILVRHRAIMALSKSLESGNDTESSPATPASLSLSTSDSLSSTDSSQEGKSNAIDTVHSELTREAELMGDSDLLVDGERDFVRSFLTTLEEHARVSLEAECEGLGLSRGMASVSSSSGSTSKSNAVGDSNGRSDEEVVPFHRKALFAVLSNVTDVEGEVELVQENGKCASGLELPSAHLLSAEKLYEIYRIMNGCASPVAGSGDARSRCQSFVESENRLSVQRSSVNLSSNEVYGVDLDAGYGCHHERARTLSDEKTHDETETWGQSEGEEILLARLKAILCAAQKLDRIWLMGRQQRSFPFLKGKEFESVLLSSRFEILHAVLLASVLCYGIACDLRPFPDGNVQMGQLMIQWALKNYAGFPFVVPMATKESGKPAPHSYSGVVSGNDVEVSVDMGTEDGFANALQKSMENVCQAKRRAQMQGVDLARVGSDDDSFVLEPIVSWILQSLQACCVSFSSHCAAKAASEAEARETRAARCVREKTASSSLCVICFDSAPDIATLCCGQAAHVRCMARWLETSSTMSCAYCRGSMAGSAGGGSVVGSSTSSSSSGSPPLGRSSPPRVTSLQRLNSSRPRFARGWSNRHMGWSSEGDEEDEPLVIDDGNDGYDLIGRAWRDSTPSSRFSYSFTYNIESNASASPTAPRNAEGTALSSETNYDSGDGSSTVGSRSNRNGSNTGNGDNGSLADLVRRMSRGNQINDGVHARASGNGETAGDQGWGDEHIQSQMPGLLPVQRQSVLDENVAMAEARREATDEVAERLMELDRESSPSAVSLPPVTWEIYHSDVDSDVAEALAEAVIMAPYGGSFMRPRTSPRQHMQHRQRRNQQQPRRQPQRRHNPGRRDRFSRVGGPVTTLTPMRSILRNSIRCHDCGNSAASDCVNGQCGRCCSLHGRFGCARHENGSGNAIGDSRRNAGSSSTVAMTVEDISDIAEDVDQREASFW